MLDYLEHAESLPEYIIATLRNQYNVDDVGGRINCVDRAAELLSLMPDATLTRAAVEKLLADLMGWSLENLHNNIDKSIDNLPARKAARGPEIPGAGSKGGGFQDPNAIPMTPMRAVVARLVKDPELMRAIPEPDKLVAVLSEYARDRCKVLLDLMAKIKANPDTTTGAILEKYRDSVTKQLDSLPMLTKEPPLFVTRADSAGNFTLTGLKPGRYRVVAFADENGNQKIEPASELAGVWTSDLVLTEESSDTLWVPLADHDTSALELESVTQPYARVLEANFSRPVFFDSAFADTANCSLTYPDGSVVHPHYVYMGATSKKPQFYFDSIPKPELTYKFACGTAKDSLSRALDPKHAEVEWSWVEKPSDTLPPAISSTQLRSMAKSVFPGDTLVVSFNKPVDSLESSFHIVLNKDTTAIEMKRIDPIRFMAVPASPWPTDAAIEFLQGYKDTTLAKADSNGVRDTVVELKYKRLLRFETVPKIKLASLKGTLKRANPGVTVRLVSLDTKRPYFTQCDVNGAFVFDNLMEGKYFIDYYYAESGRNTPDGGSLSPFRFGKPWRAPNDTVRVSNGENDIEKLLPDMPALP